MKALLAIILAVYWLCSATIAAYGEVLFLPLVSNQSAPADPAAAFKLETTRLLGLYENGGTVPSTCGLNHRLHVHVFDRYGDVGPGSRLDGVIVQVTHVDRQGQRAVEYRATGLAGMEHGVAEFALNDFAEIRIFTAPDGRPVNSQMAWVSTQAEAIPVAQLIAGGYCTDSITCATFVEADHCAGAYSWNVVFKRNE